MEAELNGLGTSGGRQDEPGKFTDEIGSGNGSEIHSTQWFTISTTPGLDAKPQFPISVRILGTDHADVPVLHIDKDSSGVKIEGQYHWPGVFQPTAN
jgi:hypothetical protein